MVGRPVTQTKIQLKYFILFLSSIQVAVAVTFGYVIIKIKRTKFHFEIAVNMVSLEQHSTLDSNLLTRFLTIGRT